jgi:hypothetical protein
VKGKIPLMLATTKSNKIASSAQKNEAPLTPAQIAFMTTVAIPQLDEADSRVAEKLADSVWNLCLWENDRAKTLDTKASALLALSTIAAAVVSIGANTVLSGTITIMRIVSITLFLGTVLFCLFTLLGRKYGGFLDEDLFEAITAKNRPVGTLPPFKSKDQYTCYLNETILQRWLVYRKHASQNDSKYKWLRIAQFGALLSVASILVTIVAVALN